MPKTFNDKKMHLADLPLLTVTIPKEDLYILLCGKRRILELCALERRWVDTNAHILYEQSVVEARKQIC